MATRTRKPAPKSRPARSVRVVEAPDANAPDVYTVRVDVAGEVDLYDVCRGVVADRYPVWMVRKQLGTLTETVAKEAYLVDVGEFGTSCTCLAGKYRGTCRHIDFCRALVVAGKLPNIHEEVK